MFALLRAEHEHTRCPIYFEIELSSFLSSVVSPSDRPKSSHLPTRNPAGCKLAMVRKDPIMATSREHVLRGQWLHCGGCLLPSV